MPKQILILGGGIIGSTTAYFIATHPSFNPSSGDTLTLLEATSIACAASGKAGGLVAEWARPECLVPLSVKLHRKLAEQFDGETRWGWRDGLGCGSLGLDARGGGRGMRLR